MAKRGGFPGMGMPGNMNNLMKQAQKMQRQMEENQKALEEKEFTATVGGGAVSVTVSGKREITKVTLSEEAVDPDDIEMIEDMIAAAKQISETYHCAVLCKGGHQLNDANALLYRDGSYRWFNGKRIDTPNTHGTGCTLSSAIASNLAKGYDLDTAVERAKAYISGALAAMLDLGHGSGPMDHGFDFRGKGFAEEQA